MVRQSEAAGRIAYPQLASEDIDLIIDQLLFAVRNRELAGQLDRAESVAAYLTQFYAKRWGMPPCITRRTQHARELAQSAPAGL